MCDESKGGHEEQKDCCAVLWISVNFARNSHQSQQSGSLQEANQSSGLQTTTKINTSYSISLSASMCVCCGLAICITIITLCLIYQARDS